MTARTPRTPGERQIFEVLPPGVLGVLAVFTLLGCERPPSADSLKEWTPADHRSQDDDKAAQNQATAPQGAKGTDVAQLVDITWRQQCTSCHGPMGKGDGQMGPMVQAPDLTSGELQTKMTDAEMLATIKNGRNKMPKFDLPEPVLAGLVARVRSLRAR
jgi:mono/diheme cytochrome c family protein